MEKISKEFESITSPTVVYLQSELLCPLDRPFPWTGTCMGLCPSHKSERRNADANPWWENLAQSRKAGI